MSADRVWNRRETAAALAVAAVIAVVGGGAIYAATDQGAGFGPGGHGQFVGPPPGLFGEPAMG